MEQRDLIKDQIEQLGKVLGKILADFLGLKTQGNTTSAIEFSNEQFQEKLDINIEVLISLQKGELKKYLVDRQLTDDHLETLSEYLKEVGASKKKLNDPSSNSYFTKAMELLDIADELTNTISFSRISKKSRIESEIQN